jgi:hypothetical protein
MPEFLNSIGIITWNFVFPIASGLQLVFSGVLSQTYITTA